MICLNDLERAAREILPVETYDFVAGGSGDELALRRNRVALDDVCIVPRVLRDVSRCDLATVLLRISATMPIAVAPMAYQQLLHPGGELALARVARAAGIPYVVSMLTGFPLSELAATGADLWLQLYWLRDRGRILELVKQSEAAGCRGLVLTVDVARMGRRLRDMRNGFGLTADIRAVHLQDTEVEVGAERTAGRSAMRVQTESAFDPALSWADLDWLGENTRLPIVLKGVLDPRDAERAADRGVAGIIVSNHGGRQMDGAPAPIVALPGVVEAVSGRCEVLLDSGIRSGVDVLRALCLGASGVLLGRPLLWGLAVDGEAGAGHVLGLLRSELVDAMALAGVPTLADAAGLLTWPSGLGPPSV